MLTLCLMLSATYYAQNYAQNYAGIISWGLIKVHTMASEHDAHMCGNPSSYT